MSQPDLHTGQHRQTLESPPLRNSGGIIIITKLSESYRQWHDALTGLPRLTRYTLGARIDNLFTECLDLSLRAGFAPRLKKIDAVENLSVCFDSLKFFLKLLWEMKALDNKKYTAISTSLAMIGKMIGGWLKEMKKQTPSA